MSDGFYFTLQTISVVHLHNCFIFQFILFHSGRVLHEVVLNESIRYANGDPVERWLYDLLCLDASNVSRISSGCPLPEACDLYYINRDTLFSYHKASETFLHRVMALYVSSHYKVGKPAACSWAGNYNNDREFCLIFYSFIVLWNGIYRNFTSFDSKLFSFYCT